MSNSQTKISNLDIIMGLRSEIERLKTELLTSKVTQDLGFEMAAATRKQLEQIHQHNQWLEARNKALENPEPGYEDLGWMGKIAFCIRKQGRPLRKREIMRELKLMDKGTRALNNSYNPEKLISSVLSRGVAAKRIHLFSTPGTRGAYYVLEDWLDEHGKLDDEMLYEMF